MTASEQKIFIDDGEPKPAGYKKELPLIYCGGPEELLEEGEESYVISPEFSGDA